MTTDPWVVLSDTIAEAAVTIPDAHLQVLAERLTGCPDPATAWRLVREPPVAQYTEMATKIINAWVPLADAINGAAVAAMVNTARATRQRTADEENVELVWTGPDSTAIRAKPTSHVVTDVINAARHHLLLVSFATRRVERIHTALHAAADRGVDISLVVETPDAAGDQYAQHGQDPFGDIPATRYTWNPDLRPRNGDRVAVLHAKLVIADDTTAFVTSANLTGRALDDNIEAGVLITGGPIPKNLRDHFRDLTYQGVLIPTHW